MAQNITSLMNQLIKLSDTDQTKCEGLITEAECISALKLMKNQKSPGSDGITVEFYKLFLNNIKEFYVNSINHSFQIGSLTELQKKHYNNHSQAKQGSDNIR